MKCYRVWLDAPKTLIAGDSMVCAMVLLPILIYDNHCTLCAKFARVANWLAGSRIRTIGHYTPEGERIRRRILGESATEMFWVVDRRAAYGGRAALIPLLRLVLAARGSPGEPVRDDSCGDDSCSVFARSASLVTRSRKIVFDSGLDSI